jgi:hypothetical protein
MQHAPNTACTSLPNVSSELPQSRESADLVYQAVTIAAILLLLGSLWVF